MTTSRTPESPEPQDHLSYPELQRASLAKLSEALQKLFPSDAAARELADLVRELPKARGARHVVPSWDLPSVLHAISLARAAVASSPQNAWASRASLVLDRIEARVGWQMRQPLRDRMYGLYVIVDLQATGGRTPEEIARAALAGGARMIQLRAKGADKGDVLPLAQRLAGMCAQKGAVFIVNDHADLARAVNADGVHVGQHDLPVAAARQVLLPSQAIGRSNALLDEARQSEAAGVDYVAVGAIYRTGTKDNTRPAGLETLRRVKAEVKCPVVAIGGINASNVTEVVKAGADVVSVISAVGLATHPEDAARDLVDRIRRAGGRA